MRGLPTIGSLIQSTKELSNQALVCCCHGLSSTASELARHLTRGMACRSRLTWGRAGCMADLHVAALPCKSTPGAQVAVHSQTVQTVEASRPVMPGRVPPRVPVRVPVHVRVPVPVPDSGSSYGRSVPALHSTPLTRVVVLVVQRTVPGTTYKRSTSRDVLLLYRA